MNKKQSLVQLESLIDNFSNVDGGMLYRNTFAIACYLSLQGESQAARKTLHCLFDVLGWDRKKTYFLALMESLDEFSEEYAVEIHANLEINQLFKVSA